MCPGTFFENWLCSLEIRSMNWKRDCIPLVFGMLIVLIIFGDSMQVGKVGNLDTVFGETYWRLMDVIYPLASIILFLLYGKLKGGIKIHFATLLSFVAFLAGLSIIQFDDIFVLMNHPIMLPWSYWTAARWCFLFIAPASFFTFGWLCGLLNRRQGKAPII
jgi:hypothetical protein